MLKDNQLTTVILLVALGLLIYYLTRPKTEGFADEESMPLATQTLLTQVVSSPEKDRIVNINEAATPSRDQSTRSQEQNTLEETVVQEEVHSFGANDIGEMGADLDAAFEKPLPSDARPDVVDLNKNNVANYNAKDFLPKEINDEWFDTDFSQAKFNINDDKLINTERYVIGINTVGQSLKNASYDIRGTVPNPKFSVSPWNNSTIEADYNLRSLC